MPLPVARRLPDNSHARARQLIAHSLPNKTRLMASFPNQTSQPRRIRLKRLEATLNPPTHNP
jgi:hypothetical protein